MRSGLGSSSLYFSESNVSRLSSGTGGRFEEYDVVRGRPRKSAIRSSVFFEKFIGVDLVNLWSIMSAVPSKIR